MAKGKKQNKRGRGNKAGQGTRTMENPESEQNSTPVYDDQIGRELDQFEDERRSDGKNVHKDHGDGDQIGRELDQLEDKQRRGGNEFDHYTHKDHERDLADQDECVEEEEVDSFDPSAAPPVRVRTYSQNRGSFGGSLRVPGTNYQSRRSNIGYSESAGNSLSNTTSHLSQGHLSGGNLGSESGVSGGAGDRGRDSTSRLSIQTNQDEFLLINGRPSSSMFLPEDGRVSYRSHRSYATNATRESDDWAQKSTSRNSLGDYSQQSGVTDAYAGASGDVGRTQNTANSTQQTSNEIADAIKMHFEFDASPPPFRYSSEVNVNRLEDDERVFSNRRAVSNISVSKTRNGGDHHRDDGNFDGGSYAASTLTDYTTSTRGADDTYRGERASSLTLNGDQDQESNGGPVPRKRTSSRASVHWADQNGAQVNVRLDLNEGSTVHVHTDLGDVDMDMHKGSEVHVPHNKRQTEEVIRPVSADAMASEQNSLLSNEESHAFEEGELIASLTEGLKKFNVDLSDDGSPEDDDFAADEQLDFKTEGSVKEDIDFVVHNGRASRNVNSHGTSDATSMTVEQSSRGARHSRSSLEAAAAWGQSLDADGNCEPVDETAKEQVTEVIRPNSRTSGRQSSNGSRPASRVSDRWATSNIVMGMKTAKQPHKAVPEVGTFAPSVEHMESDMGREELKKSNTNILRSRSASECSSRSNHSRSHKPVDILAVAPSAEQLHQALEKDKRYEQEENQRQRSRSASCTSRRSDGVVFSEMPELYSHPDDRFGDSIVGEPFRRTVEHEKTPAPQKHSSRREQFKSSVPGPKFVVTGARSNSSASATSSVRSFVRRERAIEQRTTDLNRSRSLSTGREMVKLRNTASSSNILNTLPSPGMTRREIVLPPVPKPRSRTSSMASIGFLSEHQQLYSSSSSKTPSGAGNPIPASRVFTDARTPLDLGTDVPDGTPKSSRVSRLRTVPVGSVFNDSPAGFNRTQFNREDWERKKREAPKFPKERFQEVCRAADSKSATGVTESYVSPKSKIPIMRRMTDVPIKTTLTVTPPVVNSVVSSRSATQQQRPAGVAPFGTTGTGKLGPASPQVSRKSETRQKTIPISLSGDWDRDDRRNDAHGRYWQDDNNKQTTTITVPAQPVLSVEMNSGLDRSKKYHTEARQILSPTAQTHKYKDSRPYYVPSPPVSQKSERDQRHHEEQQRQEWEREVVDLQSDRPPTSTRFMSMNRDDRKEPWRKQASERRAATQRIELCPKWSLGDDVQERVQYIADTDSHEDLGSWTTAGQTVVTDRSENVGGGKRMERVESISKEDAERYRTTVLEECKPIGIVPKSVLSPKGKQIRKDEVRYGGVAEPELTHYKREEFFERTVINGDDVLSDDMKELGAFDMNMSRSTMNLNESVRRKDPFREQKQRRATVASVAIPIPVNIVRTGTGAAESRSCEAASGKQKQTDMSIYSYRPGQKQDEDVQNNYDIRPEASTKWNEEKKYDGSTLRRALPKRGHIKNIAAAFEGMGSPQTNRPTRQTEPVRFTAGREPAWNSKDAHTIDRRSRERDSEVHIPYTGYYDARKASERGSGEEIRIPRNDQFSRKTKPSTGWRTTEESANERRATGRVLPIHIEMADTRPRSRMESIASEVSVPRSEKHEVYQQSTRPHHQGYEWQADVPGYTSIQKKNYRESGERADQQPPSPPSSLPPPMRDADNNDQCRENTSPLRSPNGWSKSPDTVFSGGYSRTMNKEDNGSRVPSHAPDAHTRASTLRSITSQRTDRYEGAIDQMFQFVEAERTLSRSHYLPTADEHTERNSVVSDQMSVHGYQPLTTLTASQVAKNHRSHPRRSSSCPSRPVYHVQQTLMISSPIVVGTKPVRFRLPSEFSGTQWGDGHWVMPTSLSPVTEERSDRTVTTVTGSATPARNNSLLSSTFIKSSSPALTRRPSMISGTGGGVRSRRGTCESTTVNEPVGTLNRDYGVHSPDFDESGPYAEIEDRREAKPEADQMAGGDSNYINQNHQGRYALPTGRESRQSARGRQDVQSPLDRTARLTEEKEVLRDDRELHKPSVEHHHVYQEYSSKYTTSTRPVEQNITNQSHQQRRQSNHSSVMVPSTPTARVREPEPRFSPASAMFNVPGEAIETYGTPPKGVDTSMVSMRMAKEKERQNAKEVRSSRLIDSTVTEPLWSKERDGPVYGDGTVPQTPSRGPLKTKMNQIIGFLSSPKSSPGQAKTAKTDGKVREVAKKFMQLASKPRSRTPEPIGSVRIRDRSTLDFNVSMKGSRTPAAPRRPAAYGQPLATSTPYGKPTTVVEAVSQYRNKVQTPTVLKNAYDLGGNRGTLESNVDAEKRFSELYTPPRPGSRQQSSGRTNTMNTESSRPLYMSEVTVDLSPRKEVVLGSGGLIDITHEDHGAVVDSQGARPRKCSSNTYGNTLPPAMAPLSLVDVGIHPDDEPFEQSGQSPHTARTFVTSTPRDTLTGAARQAGAVARLADWDDTFVSTITTHSTKPGIHASAPRQEVGKTQGKNVKDQIDKLLAQLKLHEEQIQMTEKALSLARKKNKALHEITAQRTLLVARERVLAVNREIQRLHAWSQCDIPPPPPISRDMRGMMIIDSITIHLNRNFCQRAVDNNSSYAFLIVLKCGVEVEATAPVTLVDSNYKRIRQLQFSETVRFCNLPVDFAVILEIYAMKMRDPRNDSDPSCAGSLAIKARHFLTPNSARKLYTPTKSTAKDNVEQNPGEFIKCGTIILNRDTAGMKNFYMDDPVYPLDGQIEINSRCTTLPAAVEVEFRGFLTMYQVVSGQGSWVRFWAVLRRGIVHFWKDPVDVDMDKAPIALMDLCKCTEQSLLPATMEVCSRPYAFSVDMLVNTTPSLIEKKRVLLSADSNELRQSWLAAFNETLQVIRGQSS